MQATLEQPIVHQMETISSEHWNELHTIEELDASLKTIIHKHFHFGMTQRHRYLRQIVR